MEIYSDCGCRQNPLCRVDSVAGKTMWRVGNKAAGRLLDGVLHNEFHT